jgi:medium-chain acyl-[acyl-carrier-protein] hydrolase
MRLFCFPFGGGTAASFFGWRDKLSDGIEVHPIEYPGRGSRWRETARVPLDSLVEALTDELRPHLDRPFALLGHSFGAIVAFEVAHRLHQAEGLLPVRLFVSGARAPHLPLGEPPIHDLPDREFLERLLTYGGIPEEVLQNPDLLALVLPIIRHDFRLFEQYLCPVDRSLPVPVTAFGGLQDPKVSASDLLAWSRCTTKSFRVRFFAGAHFFLSEQQARMLKEVSSDLLPPPGQSE